MKKLLSIIGAVGLTATATATAVACANTNKTHLNRIIKVQDLGEMLVNPDEPSPTYFEIIEKVQDLNKDDLKKSGIYNNLKIINITSTSATIRLKEKSSKSFGSVTVKFKTKMIQKKILSSLIKNTDLGKIEVLDAFAVLRNTDLVIDKINELNPDVHLENDGNTVLQIFEDFIWWNKTEPTFSVILWANSNSRKYYNNDKITLNFSVKPQQKVDLTKYLTETDLGKISVLDEHIQITIRERIYWSNIKNLKHIDTSDFNIKYEQLLVNNTILETTENSATLTVKENSPWFETGSFNFTYTLVEEDTRLPLKDTISNLNLGVFDVNVKTLVPTEKEILDRIVSWNQNLDKTEVIISEITETSATITARSSSTKYVGEVKVTYETAIKKINLINLITQPNLGIIEVPNPFVDDIPVDLIIKKIEALNGINSLDKNDLDFELVKFDGENVDKNYRLVEITAKDSSKKYEGKTLILYKVTLQEKLI